MKPYPKGKQRRKLAAMAERLDRILAGEIASDEARAEVVQAARAVKRALAKWQVVGLVLALVVVGLVLGGCGEGIKAGANGCIPGILLIPGVLVWGLIRG